MSAPTTTPQVDTPTAASVLRRLYLLRRRAVLGVQWVLLVSGVLSTLAGVVFVVAAGSPDPSVGMVAGYAGLGGMLFAVDALVLGRQASRTARQA